MSNTDTMAREWMVRDSWRRWPVPEVAEPGTTLFREGSVATDVFWIIEGVVKLAARQAEQPDQSSEPDRTAAVGLRRGWTLLGPFTPKHPETYTVSASAITWTRLYRFTVADFRERLADPEFRECACQAMSHALQADVDDDTRVCLRDPEQRLVALLSTSVNESDSTEDCVKVSLPHGIDIADLAGLIRATPTEMTRLLKDWTHRGYVRHEQHNGQNEQQRFVFCGDLVFDAMRWRTSREGAGARNELGVRPASIDDSSDASTSFNASTFNASTSFKSFESADPSCVVDPSSLAATHPAVPPAALRRVRDARVIKALALINDAYAQDTFGIRELSRHVNLSQWHLSRLLKSATRMTFGQLRNAVRIERARVALLTTELSIKEIAAGVGYTHASDLTRHFRSIHRLSPIAYRMQARQTTFTDALP